MLLPWLLGCLAIAALLALLGLAAGNASDSAPAPFKKEYARESKGSFGCGFVLIVTVVLLVWSLRHG